jgi:hypothetical protein
MTAPFRDARNADHALPRDIDQYRQIPKPKPRQRIAELLEYAGSNA